MLQRTTGCSLFSQRRNPKGSKQKATKIMKCLLLLLVALAAAQFTVGIKSAEINGEQRLLRSKGDDDEYSGKGKVSLEK
jgi:hypothetical protein